jgi:hypothetical protein
MADETLRMQAEVVDRFSGPLKSLRSQLLDTSRQGAGHGEALAKGLGKVEGAAKSAGQAASTVLNPALATVGVTSLSAVVAVNGIVSALKSFGGSISALGQLGRETGMAADQLRVFQSVAGKFGISGDESAAAAKSFANNMRDIRRGVGETMGFLQSQNPIVAQFALKLKGTKSNDEAMKLAEDFIEQIPDAVDRGRFAEKLFGNVDFGRLGDRHLGSIAKLRDKMQEKLGPLDPAAVESAEKFERAMSDLRSSMSKVGMTIASELMVPAEKFTSWMNDLVSGQRGDLLKGLRQGLQDVKKELGEINWKQAGDDATAFLRESTALAGSLAKAFHEVAEVIHSLRDGEYAQALRGADGAQGPLARRLAPRVGDDQINAEENVDRLRKLRDMSKEASGLLIGRTQQRMGLMDTPEAAQQKLDAAEAELNRLKSRSPEQRQKDFEASDKLRKSIENLTDEMKSRRDGATAQKSSADGDGPFAGARVQTAGYGGARLYGGGSGPGYRGEQGERDAAREQFREHLKRTVPGYTGGDTVPLAPGARVSPMDGNGPRMPPLEGARGRPARGALGANQQEAYRAARAEGLSDAAARALVANMTGESLGNPRDHHWDRKHMSQGIVQWDPQRAEAIRQKFGAYPKDMSVTDQTRAAIDEIRSNRRFGRTARALEGNDPNAMLGALVENYEAPQDTGRALAERRRHYRDFRPNGDAAGSEPNRIAGNGDFLPNGAPRVLKPNSMKDAPGLTADEASRLRSGNADGDAWAAREKARKAFETMQQGEGRLDASAGRAGVMGGNKLEANGSVYVQVHKPGPETNVRTSASGSLFKDVVLSRGRTMAPAERT